MADFKCNKLEVKFVIQVEKTLIDNINVYKVFIYSQALWPYSRHHPSLIKPLISFCLWFLCKNKLQLKN